MDLLIAVIEPGTRAVETLDRIEKLGRDIGIERIAVVVNKFIESEKARELISGINYPILGVIPYDQCFVKADLENIPPYKLCDLKPFEEIKKRIEELVQ